MVKPQAFLDQPLDGFFASHAYDTDPDPAVRAVRRRQRRVRRRANGPGSRGHPAQAILTGTGSAGTVMAIFFAAIAAYQ